MAAAVAQTAQWAGYLNRTGGSVWSVSPPACVGMVDEHLWLPTLRLSVMSLRAVTTAS